MELISCCILGDRYLEVKDTMRNVKCLIIWPLEKTNNSERTIAYDAFSTFNNGWHHANIKLWGRTSERQYHLDLTSDPIFLKHWQCQENWKNWSLPYDKLWLSLLSRYRWRTENGKHRTYRRRRRNDNCVLQLPLPGSLVSNLLFNHFLWFSWVPHDPIRFIKVELDGGFSEDPPKLRPVYTSAGPCVVAK